MTLPPNIAKLERVFFGRMFDNEVFSSSTAASSSLMWILAAVATPGVMMSAGEVFTWAHVRAMGERLNNPAILDSRLLSSQAFHVSVAMAVAGLVTMIVWNSLTPDRRDAMVLGTLPVTPQEQSYARLLALLRFFVLLMTAVAVPTAIVFTFVSSGPADIGVLHLKILGHVAAAVLGGGLVFFSLVAIQLLLAALFGPNAIRFVTLPLQLAAMAGMIAALTASQELSGALLGGQGMTATIAWNPAAWMVGVYRSIGGDGREVFDVLAIRGAIASLSIIAFTIAIYPLAYDRCIRNIIAAEGRHTSAMSRGWATLAARALRPLLPAPLQRGLAAFMIATVGRSHAHRYILGLYAGLAVLQTMAVMSRLAGAPDIDPRYVWFVVPLGFVFWLVCGLRFSLMMPVEPRANWIFRLTEPVDKRRMLTVVVTVMQSMVVTPVATVTAIALLAAGDQRLALTAFAVVSLGGLCLVEFLTLTMRAVPFSCTYLPGQLKLRYYWVGYFYLWLTFVFTLGNWSLWALESPRQTAYVLAGLFALWSVLRIWHLARIRKLRVFVYDEQEDAITTTIDINAMMRQI
ncbi:MAG: hypothetical protein RLZZ53_2787 [Acidobacteriota bacterium]